MSRILIMGAAVAALSMSAGAAFAGGYAYQGGYDAGYDNGAYGQGSSGPSGPGYDNGAYGPGSGGAYAPGYGGGYGQGDGAPGPVYAAPYGPGYDRAPSPGYNYAPGPGYSGGDVAEGYGGEPSYGYDYGYGYGYGSSPYDLPARYCGAEAEFHAQQAWAIDQGAGYDPAWREQNRQAAVDFYYSHPGAWRCAYQGR